jgi:hypothetical protein
MVGAGTTSKLEALVTVTPLDVTEMGPSAAPAGTVTTMVVALEEVTVALTPLKNSTTGDAPKLVTLMVIVAPTAPVAGVKPVIAGVGSTVKLEALDTVTPLEVTEIGPVAAPAGTVTTMVVALEEVTVALMPLKNCTTGEAPKLVPVRVTVAPGAPLVGEKLVMAGVASTVKLEALVAVTPDVVTEIGPVDAPEGTSTVNEVEAAPVTVAAVPLNSTMLLDGVVLKLVPVIVTVAPTAPLVGEKLVMVGGASTSKLDALVTVTPLEVTLISPSEANAGTVTTMVVALAEVTKALTPLN